MEIRPIDDRSRERVNAFIEERWFSLKMAVGGELIDLGTAEGFYYEDCGEIIGLLTYRICGDRAEILSLDSLRGGLRYWQRIAEQGGRRGKDTLGKAHRACDYQ